MFASLLEKVKYVQNCKVNFTIKLLQLLQHSLIVKSTFIWCTLCQQTHSDAVLMESLEVAAAQSGHDDRQKLLPCSLSLRGEGGSELARDHNGETIGKKLRENTSCHEAVDDTG